MIEAERKRVVMESPRRAETRKKTIGRGAAELRAAADMFLDAKCIEIAESLAESSLKGHIQSTKFLFALADGHQELDAEEVSGQLRSLATEWAAEPQWIAEMNEQMAETTGGSREPED